MNSPAYLTLLLVGLFALLANGAERPNIVLIMADDMGYECLSANGSLDYKTPNLDAMAARGLRFEHCYSQPICTPSRVKLMTGKSNKRNYLKFGKLDRSQRTFAHLLKRAGYATCIAGKWQLGREVDAPKHFGFDQALLWQHTRPREDKQKHDTRYPNPRLERNGEQVDYEDGEFSTDVFVDFIKEFIQENRREPFMVYYPMALVHCPFCPTPHSDDWKATSRGSTTYKGQPEYFGDMVSYADKAVGDLLTFLKDSGLEDNTLIMFIGDNGTDTPIVSNTTYGKVIGAKGKTVDGGNHVPCVMQWPAVMKKPGQVIQDIIDFSDFLPTMCEAVGTKLPDDFLTDGRSFLPQIMGNPGTPRESIYQWYSRNGVPQKAVVFARNQTYKLYEDGKMFDIPNDRTEQQPLSELTPEQQAVRGLLQRQLDEFKDVANVVQEQVPLSR